MNKYFNLFIDILNVLFFFNRLCKLRILEVRENRLKTLPKSLSRLTELERLDLGTNDFDVFVNKLFYSKKLKLN